MCGIVAVLRRVNPDAAVPDLARVAAAITARGGSLSPGTGVDAWRECARELARQGNALCGADGLAALLANPDGVGALRGATDTATKQVAALEIALDQGQLKDLDPEAANAVLVDLKDALWSIHKDRMATLADVQQLLGDAAPPAGGWALPEARHRVAGYLSIHTALASLDLMEVRGRDSSGIAVVLDGVDGNSPGLQPLLQERLADPLGRNGAARMHVGADGRPCLVFLYKVAAEIGELGDNGAALRRSITADQALHAALATPGVETTVLGHTRWASVGIISEANAHPQVSGPDGPLVLAVLNGDVDNHARLVTDHSLEIPIGITTDAKVIPMRVADHRNGGTNPGDAFAQAVREFTGSTAIGAVDADAPGEVLLALKGSGQALYVGQLTDGWVAASEPYGVVEEAIRYRRLDGETPSDPARADATRGQVVRLTRDPATTPEWRSWDGGALPAPAVIQASITTRDIDRGEYRHFLRKEINDAPGSLRKTLRGRLLEQDGQLQVQLGEDNLPGSIAEKLRSGAIRRINVIGQGTAAVAGEGIALALQHTLQATPISVAALPATELSGFLLRDDMSDLLVVAISQSGTTTDTNRTVDLVRRRGAVVLAIVNRRASDLTDKADGVIYTSDGRDIEMSVASTKAFYAQVAAGWLLAHALADAAGAPPGDAVLRALRDLPDGMARVLADEAQVAAAAKDLAPGRRYWAVVGNGPNRVAAREIRIKLSELCYKSIAADATEDKKHIDLSSEPLILVCAAGLEGPIAEDVRKEIAIFRAHKAAPIAVLTADGTQSPDALHTIRVPVTHPALAPVFSTMVGHLFGYHAALAIDATAAPLRELRSRLETAASEGTDPLNRLRDEGMPFVAEFQQLLRDGRYDGSLEASTASRTAVLLIAAIGQGATSGLKIDVEALGTPGSLVADLEECLTRAIEELTRPVDAIKHQAKTVTVGISRADEALLAAGLVQAVLAGGADHDHLGGRDLAALAALDGCVRNVAGATRYTLGGTAPDHVTATVAHRSGMSEGLASRYDTEAPLTGTKLQVVREGKLLVARGRRDDRVVMLVPESDGSRVNGLTLLHVELHNTVTTPVAEQALAAYRGRLAALVAAVTETEPRFDAEGLGSTPVGELLMAPIQSLADRWR